MGRTWDVCEGSLFDGEIIDTCQCIVSIVHGLMTILSITSKDDGIGLEIKEDQTICDGDIDGC